MAVDSSGFYVICWLPGKDMNKYRWTLPLDPINTCPTIYKNYFLESVWVGNINKELGVFKIYFTCYIYILKSSKYHNIL